MATFRLILDLDLESGTLRDNWTPDVPFEIVDSVLAQARTSFLLRELARRFAPQEVDARIVLAADGTLRRLPPSPTSAKRL